MIPVDVIEAAVADLARDGIAVTVQVEALAAPGTPTPDDALFVHVVRTRQSEPATWAAIFCRMHRICPSVRIN